MITVTDRDGHGPQFTLQNRYFHYSCGIFDRRFLVHLFWGDPLESPPRPETLLKPQALDYMPRIRYQTPSKEDREEEYYPGTLPFEYPAWGTGDLREGAFRVLFEDGTEACELVYQNYEIFTRLVQPEGMPIVHQANSAGSYTSLRIRLADPRGDLQVDLYYGIGENLTGLLRWVRFRNTGDAALRIENPASASIDLPGKDCHLIRLTGNWARERHVFRSPLAPGSQSVESRNGASGHQASPFIALVDKGTTEQNGSAYAMALGYSGNFCMNARLDEHENVRIRAGIHRFSGLLEQGEHLDTPTALLVQTSRGMNSLSERFHRFVREANRPPQWRHKPLPVIINSWEAMYYAIDENKILELARQGKKIGAELLVLDDGWFSGRRDDTTSLGDWWYNGELFPQGVGKVGDAVRREGLEFGLWIEPEMVSPNSRLYKDHPDWVIGCPDRLPTLVRNQLVLDLSNPEVVEYLFTVLTSVLKEARPTYLKWDMNRNMTEPGSPIVDSDRQGEVMHRYILGLYTLLGRLQEAFPSILIEGCAGGGGRLDLGLGYYHLRFWTSDQTDFLERLPIQYGSSLIFPPESLGTHVSAVPNHQVGRITPRESRAWEALPFSFGYELDPSLLDEETRTFFASVSKSYRKFRPLFHTGRFIRLRGPLAEAQGSTSPRELSKEYAWMVLGPEQKNLFIFYFRLLKPGTMLPGFLPLGPFGGSGTFRDVSDNQRYDAVLLERRGLRLTSAKGDYQAVFKHLVAQEKD